MKKLCKVSILFFILYLTSAYSWFRTNQSLNFKRILFFFLFSFSNSCTLPQRRRLHSYSPPFNQKFLIVSQLNLIFIFYWKDLNNDNISREDVTYDCISKWLQVQFHLHCIRVLKLSDIFTWLPCNLYKQPFLCY